MTLQLDEGDAGTLTTSPDGRYVTFLAKGKDARSLLWLRALDEGQAYPASGTEGATFLPDGRRFLYMAGTHAAGSRSEANAVYLGDLESGESKLLLHARSNVEYANGHLLYVRENVLVAHPFDERRLELTGDPVPLAQGVQYSSGFFHAAFSVSHNGVLVYRVGGERNGISLEWVDRQGKTVGTIASPTADSDRASYMLPALSPDGEKLAIALNDRKSGRDDIWIIDLRRNVPTRFTFGGGDETAPCWSPDGKRVLYARLDGAILNLYGKASNGEGDEESVLRSDLHKFATDWSRDGRFVAVQTFDPSAKLQNDIWVLPMDGEPKLRPFLQTPFDEGEPRFSPDGAWIAYASNESGAEGLYVSPFPGPGGKYQISNDVADGSRAQWGPGGTEIYYSNRESSVMVVGVTPRGGALEIGAPRALFNDPTLAFWVLDPKGQRFIVGRVPEEGRLNPITLVTRWTNKLKR